MRTVPLAPRHHAMSAARAAMPARLGSRAAASNEAATRSGPHAMRREADIGTDVSGRARSVGRHGADPRGAGRGTRTLTVSPPADFESAASAVPPPRRRPILLAARRGAIIAHLRARIGPGASQHARESDFGPVDRASALWVGLQPCGSGFSPTGCGDMPWVGLQPDGVRAGAKQMRRPEGRPTKNGPRRSMRRPGIAGASVLCRLTSVF